MGRRLVAASPFKRGYMSYISMPVLMPKWQSGSFNVVRAPYLQREHVIDLVNDSVYCSLFASPNDADCTILFELYDGEDWTPIGVVVARTGVLIGANDTGYVSLMTVVRAHWKALYNELHKANP